MKQDEVVDAVRRGQQPLVAAVGICAGIARMLAPPLPASARKALPAPADLVDRAFNLAAALLEAQRGVAHDVLAAAGVAPRAAPKRRARPGPSAKPARVVPLRADTEA